MRHGRIATAIRLVGVTRADLSVAAGQRGCGVAEGLSALIAHADSLLPGFSIREGPTSRSDTRVPLSRYRFHASNLSEFGEKRPREDPWYKVYVMRAQLSCCCQWAMCVQSPKPHLRRPALPNVPSEHRASCGIRRTGAVHHMNDTGLSTGCSKRVFCELKHGSKHRFDNIRLPFCGRYMDSDAFFRMASAGRSVEAWLASVSAGEERIDLWTTDSEPKPEGPHDRFFAVGLDGNPVLGGGSALALFRLTVRADPSAVQPLLTAAYPKQNTFSRSSSTSQRIGWQI